MQMSHLCYTAMAQAQLGKVAAYSGQLSKRLGLTSIYCLVEEASYQDHLQDNLLRTPHRKRRPFAEPLAAENDSSSHTVMYVGTARRDCCGGFPCHTG